MTDAAQKKALVTGASGGLGRAIARRLFADGFEVWLHYRENASAARELCDEIVGAGGSARLLCFDLCQTSEIDKVLVPLLDTGGPLDVLVNNAGTAADGFMIMLPESQWHNVIEVNLGGFFRVTRACLKGMIKKRAGRVINVGSLAGTRPAAGQVAYAAAKAGLFGATRALAMEMARWNILVNAVSPGPLDVGMAGALELEKILPAIPLGRLGRAEEVAGAVSFLASSDATYLTGQVLHVNGGMDM